MMQCLHSLHNVHNRIILLICLQMISCYTLPHTFSYRFRIYFSVNTRAKSKMELVWKYGRLSSILFLKSSIPFHYGIFHISYRSFRSITFHFPFHSIPCPVCTLFHSTDKTVQTFPLKRLFSLEILQALPIKNKIFKVTANF